LDNKSWNEIVRMFPQPHFLQTWEWGEIKQKYGWEKDFKVWHDGDGNVIAAAMILMRSARFLKGLVNLRILYIPRGPLFVNMEASTRKVVLDDLQEYARTKKAVFIKMDPEIIIYEGMPGEADEGTNQAGIAFQEDLKKRKWFFSSDQIQFRNTVVINLEPPEEDLLAAMKQKTRYNIRLAERRGVSIRQAHPADFSLLYDMYLETSLRDGFIIREREYYLDVWELFTSHAMAQAFIAEAEGEAVAGLFLFFVGKQAWYFYGMSTDRYKEKMPNYLLQWEAMRFAKNRGVISYDLWGAPDAFEPSDRLWGVFRFKQGLGGTVQRTIGAWDYSPRKFLYFLYQQVLPKILGFTRKQRRKAMSGEMS